MIARFVPAALDRTFPGAPRLPTRWPWLPDRRFVTEVPPHRIHAAEFGADGEPLVLLHGLSGSSRWWRRNVPELARTSRVVVPDVIGFGRTRVRGTLPPSARSRTCWRGGWTAWRWARPTWWGTPWAARSRCTWPRATRSG